MSTYPTSNKQTNATTETPQLQQTTLIQHVDQSLDQKKPVAPPDCSVTSPGYQSSKSLYPPWVTVPSAVAAPNITPYHYIQHQQDISELQSHGFDYAFGNPFENPMGMQYLPDSQFVGYRSDGYGLNFDPHPHSLAFGASKVGSQYPFASQRYQAALAPSQQYPDTQLLHPTFAHPSESPSTAGGPRNGAEGKSGTPVHQIANQTVVHSTGLSRTASSSMLPASASDYHGEGAAFNMQMCQQNQFMLGSFNGGYAVPQGDGRLHAHDMASQHTLGHSSVSSSSTGISTAGSNAANSMRRKNASRETTAALKTWLFEHRKNPYPTKGEKIMLAIITKMSLTQISTWFANARRRLKKENKMTWTPKNKTNSSSANKNSSASSVMNQSNSSPSSVIDSINRIPSTNDVHMES